MMSLSDDVSLKFFMSNLNVGSKPTALVYPPVSTLSSNEASSSQTISHHLPDGAQYILNIPGLQNPAVRYWVMGSGYLLFLCSNCHIPLLVSLSESSLLRIVAVLIVVLVDMIAPFTFLLSVVYIAILVFIWVIVVHHGCLCLWRLPAW